MENHEDLRLLLNEVFKERHLDFLQYREPLIQRRVATRLRATQCCSYPEYIDYLKHHRSEMDALLDALTINVTRFYRDPGVFRAVAHKIIPALFTARVIEKKEIVRIWSCGSSGGQEATTVLVAILEFFASKKLSGHKPRVLIYGTDIDKLSLAKAGEGIYQESEFKDTPAFFKQKYFLPLDSRSYARKKELNQYLLFREQDVICSEPLKNIDLILCRNLFIYFKRELQKQCIRKFYDALNRDGFLVLGLTESLWGDSPRIFAEFDGKNRIYRKM